MKLIVAIVNNDDVTPLMNALHETGFRATRIASTGSFLSQGNTTFLLGVRADDVERVLEIIRKKCHTRTRYINPMPPAAMGEDFVISQPLEVQIGGAVVFVLPIERVERY